MTDEIKYILEEEFRVTSADTDFKRKLSVSSLTNMFIQIAWHHAEELGLGVEYLHKHGLAWVLLRLHLKIEELPEWNETLRLVTWPKGIRRLFYLRDFEVFGPKGNRIAYATSEWLLIDIFSKRPKLQAPDHEIFNMNKDRHAINSEIETLIAPEGCSGTFGFKIFYSDIDLNQHLTTTRYIDHVFNAFDMDFHKTHQCKEIILNFNHEISYGEEIKVTRIRFNEENKYFLGFYNNKKINFACCITFS